METGALNKERGEGWKAEILARYRATRAEATGQTGRSLSVFATDGRLLITGGPAFALNYRDQRGFVEAGRGPGKLPPYNNIRDWLYARGFLRGLDAEKAHRKVEQLRFKIAKFGTSNWSKQTPRDIYTSVITPQAVEDHIATLSGVLIKKTESDIVKAFKK